MNIKSTLIQTADKLTTARIEQSALEAELLICGILGKPREFILAYPELSLNNKQQKQLDKFINRRINHEPLAYILKKQPFYNIELSVNKHVLIPRPETELLVETILRKEPKSDTTIIDIGVGSGAIIISLAKNISSKVNFIATDISAPALAVAKQNAADNNVADKISFIKSNLLKKFLKQKSWLGSRQLIIVANLPYLHDNWRQGLTAGQIAELNHEPPTALFAGPDGFNLYRSLAEQIKQLIKKFGLTVCLYCEIAPEQANLFTHTFAELGKVELARDLTGKIRIGIVN